MKCLPLVILATVACTVASEKPADTTSSRTSSTTTTTTTTTKIPKDTTTHGTAWTVRADGIGPVHIGMTSGEVRGALGMQAEAPASGQGCSYLAGTAATALHANAMLENDTLVRVDIVDATAKTAEGARVGDTEARVQQLYPGVVVQPHKYNAGGHYLVVTPAGDAAHQIIFETDGRVVTKYRAGQLPQVAQVEGCG